MVQPRINQLLRLQLYPATVIDPMTAATFRVLDFFLLNTLVSKISAFDFYATLSRKTDNTGTRDVPVSLTDYFMFTDTTVLITSF